MRYRAVAGAAVLLAGIGGAAAPAAPAQTQDPTVTIDRTGVAAGEEMVVTGTGWTAGGVLIVELCGQGGLGGSTFCDVARQRTAAVGPDGSFSTPLVAGVPPRPCPCVVKVTDQVSRVAATGSIAVQGVPLVPITEADPQIRRIEVQSMDLTGGSWTEWFGASSDRVLVLTLVNTGDVSVERPALDVTWGRDSRPTGFVEVPELQPMAPGATQTVRLALPRGALSLGRYTALVSVTGSGDAPVRATSTVFPWALAVSAVLALQAVLVRIRNRLRRRLVPVAEPGPREVLALPGATAGVLADATIDLRDRVDVGDPTTVAPAEADEAAEADEPAEAEIDLRQRAREDLDAAWLASLIADQDDEVDDTWLDADPLGGLLADHRRAMGLLGLEVARSSRATADRSNGGAPPTPSRVQALLDLAAELSEALFDAAVVRAERCRARAGEHERLAAAMWLEAGELERTAEACAEELIAVAEAAAADLLPAVSEPAPHDDLDERLARALARAVRSV